MTIFFDPDFVHIDTVLNSYGGFGSPIRSRLFLLNLCVVESAFNYPYDGGKILSLWVVIHTA